MNQHTIQIMKKIDEQLTWVNEWRMEQLKEKKKTTWMNEQSNKILTEWNNKQMNELTEDYRWWHRHLFHWMIWELSFWPWLCFQILLRRLRLLFNHRLGRIWNNVLCLIGDQYQSLDNDMVIKKSVKNVSYIDSFDPAWLKIPVIFDQIYLRSINFHFMQFRCFSWTPMTLNGKQIES